MKKILLLITLAITSQASASIYDVIFRFENISPDSNEYFVIKIDFDYVASGIPPIIDQEQVFSYEEFVMSQNSSDGLFPIFYFEVELIETNMTVEHSEELIGRTETFNTIQPMRTHFCIALSRCYRTYYSPVTISNFPTGWQPENAAVETLYAPLAEFRLTEVTPIPLPAALPLFGFCLLLLARTRRN